MSQRIVIYLPYGSSCTDTQRAQITRRYPTARFVQVWQEGAIMWQDAVDKE